jgi:hypothetical protein
MITGECPTLPSCLIQVAGLAQLCCSESHFDQCPGLGLIFPLLPLLIALVSMFLLRYTPLLPFSTRMRIRDQCIYITRLGVGPHINVLQRDLSILSCPSPEQDSRLNIHSPSSPFFLFYSPFVRCIANMAAKLLSLYLLAIACLVVVRAGASAS